MSDHVSDSNVEAYHIMAEILVTVRRIVHRGLEKAAGKTWYVDGCPPDVYERLVSRKENEVAIDRFDREYQELISFASLDDLAEIIEFNEDLAHLLEGIAPDGATIAERFRQLEVFRLKLDATVPLTEEDVETLLDYHKEFRQSLAQPKKKKPEPAEEPEPVLEAIEEAEVTETQVPGDLGTQVTEPEELVAEDIVVDELGEDDVVADEASDAFETAVVDSDVIEAPPASGPPDDSAVEAEQAMASEDDQGVLRVLHREIMSVAEHVLKGNIDQEFPVWKALKESGWFDIKQTTLAISQVEEFYSIADAIRTLTREKVPEAEIKAFVAESEVGKLLLKLGEMFKRQEL
jgi:hypothetical protein